MNEIYSPQMLWKDFDSSLPLDTSVVSENVYDNLIVQNLRFWGRQTDKGRVHVYATYAFKPNAKPSSRGTILIIPDYDKTIDFDIMNIYVKQGFNVLMVDYRGKCDDVENYTVYPEEVGYANFATCGDRLDFAPETAKQTCWYEWTAVCKYAISFLQTKQDVGKIGVLGIKNGANVGWMLCATDERVHCFVSLFGAGWRAYEGVYKNADDNEIEMTDERIRYLAGVDMQAYAQSVKCPVLYLTATNSDKFDFDRSVDTITRVGAIEGSADNANDERIVNYAPRLRGVLDKQCAMDINYFFSKYLLNFRIAIPSEPKLTLSVEGKEVKAKAEINFSDTKRTKTTTVYIAEGCPNPSYRDWNTMREVKSPSEIEKNFVYRLNGNVDFISAFVRVEYKNGVTICSKVQSKKVERIRARENKLLYSSKDNTGSFSVYDVEKYASSGLFFCDEEYLLSVVGPKEIRGIYSKYGLISYKVNNDFISLSENSILKMDIFAYEKATINLVLMAVDKVGSVTEYSAKLDLDGAVVWQNIMLTCKDFKSLLGAPIKNMSDIRALRIEAETPCVINNILMI